VEKNLQEQFAEKIGLIYEYNKQSPLFVRHASTEIDNNNLDNAIAILSEGIKLYPDFPVAYLILGKALTLKGQYEEAFDTFSKGSSLFQSPETLEYYKKEIENIKKQRLVFEKSKRTTFLDNNYTFETKKAEIPPKEFLSSIDDNLSELAKRIAKAKIPEVSNSSSTSTMAKQPIAEDKITASETLAEIYLAQKQISEAIKIYQELSRKHPEKKEYYQKKIIEIPSKYGLE